METGIHLYRAGIGIDMSDFAVPSTAPSTSEGRHPARRNINSGPTTPTTTEVNQVPGVDYPWSANSEVVGKSAQAYQDGNQAFTSNNSSPDRWRSRHDRDHA